jgi:hypothetical protein
MNKDYRQSLDLINIRMGRSNKPSILKKDSYLFDASRIYGEQDPKFRLIVAYATSDHPNMYRSEPMNVQRIAQNATSVIHPQPTKNPNDPSKASYSSFIALKHPSRGTLSGA